MKKIVLLSALLIAGISVNAQENVRPTTATQTQGAADKATSQTQKLDKMVTLTPAQKEKVYAINFEKNKAVDVAATNKATYESEKSRIKAEREKEISLVLTSEQQVKLRQAQQEQQAQKK
jgi:periplasmic protein CpxP/Spy